MTIDPRLEFEKNRPRAMQSYVMMIFEFILETKPKMVLEIGVQRGQSTKTMLMAMKAIRHGKLVSIDHKARFGLLDGDYEDLKPYWQFIRGNSHVQETFDQAKAALPEGELYDILFLDGDHKMPGVGQDFDQYSELVKPGGLILMHDITNKNEDVKDVWANIIWDKFALDWGRAGGGVTPGFGLVRKPNADCSACRLI